MSSLATWYQVFQEKQLHSFRGGSLNISFWASECADDVWRAEETTGRSEDGKRLVCETSAGGDGAWSLRVV